MDNAMPATVDTSAGVLGNTTPVQNGLPILTNGAMDNTNMLDATSLTAMQGQPVLAPVLPPQGISADEIALYDRQIRLWGMKAQEMIRNAQVLLIGMRALGNEIAKNLVLAGIGSLTILDPENLTHTDLETSFLVTEDQIGQNRAEAAAIELRKMNPRVTTITDSESILMKTPEYFSMFQIVVCTNQPFEMASTINMSCRMYNVKFYASETYGFYGYIFADLILHTFTLERDQPNIQTKVGTQETSTRSIIDVQVKKEGNKSTEIVTKQELYCPFLLANSSPLPVENTKTRRTKLKVTPLLSCLRALFEFQKQSGHVAIPENTQALSIFTKFAHDKHIELGLDAETLPGHFLRDFVKDLKSELPPTCAYLGGQLAQDVINVLGGREQPLQNIMVFDGDKFESPVYSLQPLLDPTLMEANGGAMEAINPPIQPNGPALYFPQQAYVTHDVVASHGMHSTNGTTNGTKSTPTERVSNTNKTVANSVSEGDDVQSTDKF